VFAFQSSRSSTQTAVAMSLPKVSTRIALPSRGERDAAPPLSPVYSIALTTAESDSRR
jgi:hypothetical protein